MLDLERNVQGPSKELEELTAQLYEEVIPRLLRPLTVLNSIKPVLIHGDLWYGNCCTDNATGKPIVFDACAFWAHNECTSCQSNVQPKRNSRLTHLKMRLGHGGRQDIGLASHTSKPTRSIFRCPSRLKIMTIGTCCIRCK